MALLNRAPMVYNDPCRVRVSNAPPAIPAFEIFRPMSLPFACRLSKRCAALRVLGGLLWLLATCLTVAGAQTRVNLAEDSCSLALPAGWEMTPVGAKGAVLRPADPAWPPVEVAVWPIPPGGQSSPAAAAAAQETALFRLVPYARLTEREIRTDEGLPGLLVLGKVRTAEGLVKDSAFAAFADATRYYIIGVFTPPDEAERVWAGELGRLVRSFRFAAPPAPVTATGNGPLPVVTPTPAVNPPALPAPVLPAPPLTPPTHPARPPLPADPLPPLPAPPLTPPDKATPLPGGDLPPPAQPPATLAAPTIPAPLVFTRHESPRGYALPLPAGWTVSELQGRLEVTAPQLAGGVPAAGVTVWALDGIPEGQSAEAVAREILAGWGLSAAPAAGLVAREDDRLVLLAGVAGQGEAARRLVACCSVEDGQGLLSMLYARGEEFAARLPVLLRVLRDLQAGPWWAHRTAVAPQAAQWWVEPTQGALMIPFPPGWRVRGGLLLVNGVWTLSLQADSNDAQGLAITWQQPVTPFYRELTPVLSNLGWREGDRYVANAGDTPLRILLRLSPEDYLLRHWLPRSEPRLEQVVVEGREPAPAAAALASPEGQAQKIQLQGRGTQGLRQRLCLVATGEAPLRVGSNCWQAAVIQAEAPAGSLSVVSEILNQALRGATMAAGLGAGVTPAVREMVEAAHQAAAAVPGGAGPPEGLYRVLEHLSPAGQGRLWVMPPLATRPWVQAALAIEEGREPTIPELNDSYWQPTQK